MPNTPGAAFGGATDPSSLQTVSALRIIPSVQISERYDSNVFSAPRSLLHGLTPEDMVTTLTPQVRGLYTDREKLVKMNAVVGAVGSYYVNNRGLSYVGANAGVSLDMSDLLSQWKPGAKWTVSDTFFYSPQPPAFFVGDQSGEQANPIVAGFQATRAKTSSNSVNTAVEYPISKTVNLVGRYTYSFINYGTSQVPQAAPLISLNQHMYDAGISAQISPYDTVKVNLMGSEIDQGERGAFSARGGAVGWGHQYSHTVSLNAAGGAQVLSGEFQGVTTSSAVAPFGTLAILWKQPTPGDPTSMALTYRAALTPSFQFKSAAMFNHSVSFSMTLKTPMRDLAGLLAANYSVANKFGSSSGDALSWTSVGGTAGLRYRATQKMFLVLTYSYQNIDNVFGETHFAYDRHTAQLSLTQAFY